MTRILHPITEAALRQNTRISSCVHDPHTECIESGKISWDNRSNDTFVHVRFDGCLCRDLPQKRCDCIIFRFEVSNTKPTMYVIETKEGNPDLSDVQGKIQYCIDLMKDILETTSNRVRVVPILCASSFHGLDNRAFLGYRVLIFGKKTVIQNRFHDEDINEL